MALTEREKFDRFIDKHSPGVMADAFFWCGGSSWELRWYGTVILIKKGNRSAALEIHREDSYALARAMRDVGYQVRANVVRPLCESAARSPKRRAATKVRDAKRAVTPSVSG